LASLTLPARAQESAAIRPIAVVAVASVDELLQDADYLGGLIGQQLSPMIAPMVPQGLDRTRPLGVLVTQYGLPPVFALCLPVTDFNGLIAGLAGLGIAAQDAGNGVQQISAMGQTLFAKEAGGWALVSIAPPMLDGMPADPSVEFSALTQEHDVTVQVNIQNIPAEIRQQWADFMAAAARMSFEQGNDDSDEQFAARQAAMEANLAQQLRLFNELNQLTFGLAVDRAGQRALVDVMYTAVGDSELAKEFAAYREAKTNFAGFAQPDAAASLSLSVDASTMTEGDIDAAITSVREQTEAAVAEEGSIDNDEVRTALKSALSDFVDALQATLKSGGLDGGAVVNVSPDSFVLVAGGAVGDPGKIESGLKKLSEIAASEQLEMPEVKWDAESYEDIKFHVMTKPPTDSTPQSAKTMFGGQLEMAVGIGGKAVYFAMGKDWLDAVKKVVDDSAANPAKPTLPLQLTVAAKPIAEAVESGAKMDGNEQTAQIAGMISSALAQSEGRDHARVIAEPIENGVRTRIEIEGGAIQAIATGAMASQMQGAQ